MTNESEVIAVSGNNVEAIASEVDAASGDYVNPILYEEMQEKIKDDQAKRKQSVIDRVKSIALSGRLPRWVRLRLEGEYLAKYSSFIQKGGSIKELNL